LSAPDSAAQTAEPSAGGQGAEYGRGAAVLSVGIGVTGLVTYAYFSLASYGLSAADYGGITLLWSAIFFVVSVLYRPVEQLLSRTIADRDARGRAGSEHLRVAATIQLGFGVLFVALALVFRGPLERVLLGGSRALYGVLVVAVLAYAASYFARGFLAGHRHFGLYGGLVLMEATSRCLFALAVVVGVLAGQTVVALGMAAAPLVSLLVVPLALGRRFRGARAPAASPAEGPAPRAPAASAHPLAPARTAASPDPLAPLEPAAPAEPSAAPPASETEFTLARGGGFAAAVLLVMVSEQTFLNAGPLLVAATEGASGAAVAGFVFNALLIARAPLQLFQAVQTSILPHLTGLLASGEADPFRRSVNTTLVAVAAFAAAVALAMLVLGPWAMDLLFDDEVRYGRLGLVLVAVGMGLYLAAATLNQAALARGQAGRAAGCWTASASAFVVLLLVPGFEDRVLQVEIGFAAAAGLLCALLLALYRRPHERVARA
jgi:O-antigen/teichoic acid export membrane protein